MKVVRLTSKDYDFSKEIKDWESECRKLSGGSIGTKGSKTLLDFVRGHGIKIDTRKTSVNRQGGKDVVSSLTSLLQSKNFGDAEVKALEKIEDILLSIRSKNSESNPANIVFSVPEEGTYDSDGKRTGQGTTEVYGHFQGKYHAAKNATKDMTGKWLSTSKGVARPPIWQALFSNGKDDLGIKGLLPIVEDALEEIEEEENKPQEFEVSDLSNAQLDEISKSGQFQKSFVSIAKRNIRSTNEETGKNTYNIQSIRNQLAEKKIKITKKSVLDIFGIEGKVDAIIFNLKEAQIRLLLSIYFGRKIIKGNTDWKSLIKG